MLCSLTTTTLIVRASSDGDVVWATSEAGGLATATYNADILIQKSPDSQKTKSIQRSEVVYTVIVTFKMWSFSRTIIVRTAAVRIQ